MDEEVKQTHPSYGVVQISRISGGPSPLFGSSIEHSHAIRLRISRASVRRSLHHSWYSDEGWAIVEVDFSPHQWAEAITNMNTAPGTPCTIRYLDGEPVEGPTTVSVREQYSDEFEKKVRAINAQLDKDIAEIQAILAKPAVNKGDRVAIANKLSHLRMQMNSNIPYVHKAFDEAVDDTVAEAKGEIEAFMTTQVVNAGRLAVAAKMEAAQLAQPVVQVRALDAHKPQGE